MNRTSFKIEGGDYEQAGHASRALKDQLKKIGAAPDVIRRLMIATYEAEMNVVIHAYRGTLTATLDDDAANVEVNDEGPGIADITMAMTEGFSTAPPKARELGFGAGMGLPNIRRSSDWFDIESTVGQGTQLRFGVNLKPLRAKDRAAHSVRIRAEKCIECLRCLHACPTQAMRLRDSGPAVLEYLCLDCTSCVQACGAGALTLDGTVESLSPAADTTLVVPPAFLAQFGPGIPPQQVLDALRVLGFGEVIVTDSAEQALRTAMLAQPPDADSPGPMISPACPAVVNLVETKFPSLIRRMAPFVSAIEAVREQLGTRRAVFLVLCPAQKGALIAAASPARVDLVTPAMLRAAIAPRLASAAVGADRVDPSAEHEQPRLLRVTGMRHVVSVLEQIENGRMDEPDVLELFACDQGCFGSPLLNEDPFVSQRRWRRVAGESAQPPLPQKRKVVLQARPGLRLDSDMGRAIEKLARIDRLLRTLPGKDCGMCGCPTCAALAEDVILGRAMVAACRHLRTKP